MIKVLMIASLPNEDYPGKGVFNFRAAQQLSKRAEVSVLSIRTWKPGRRILKKKITGGFTQFHLAVPHLPSLKRNFHLVNSLVIFIFSVILLRKSIRQCDIIHSVSGANGPLGAMLARLFHSRHLLQLTGSDVNSEFPRLTGAWHINYMLKHTYKVVGNSLQLIQDFNGLFGTRFPEVCVYRGVDVSKFVYRPQPPGKVCRFLFLGGLDSYPFYKHGMNTKGGLTLMSAWKRLEQHLDQVNVELWFGGPSLPNAVLDEWSASLDYPERVKVLGRLTPRSLKEAYYSTSAVVIPSLEEGLPNVGMEASACGRPLIASRVGGVPELVIHGETGLLFTAGSDRELSELMLSVARGQVDVAEMGEAARARMEKYFSADQFALEYLEHYKNLCAE